MRVSQRVIAQVLSLVALTATSGCSRGPAGVEAPPIQPLPAAEAAIAQYDKNGDGLLADAELANCPSLQGALQRLDKDGDRRLSKDELAARLQMWVRSGIGVSFLTCQVTRGGRPVAGAQIKLVPEAFFGGAIQTAAGVTDNSGAALLAIDPVNLPDDLQNLRGVQQGFYRVEITHPNVSIPSKYNTETSLGIEVTFDSGNNFVTFALQ